jgi:hypothetical protein
MFVKVNGANYVRDTNSMGLSNIDMAARDEYYTKLRLIQNQKDGLNKVKEEIDELKSDVSEIKTMLAQLLSKQ